MYQYSYKESKARSIQIKPTNNIFLRLYQILDIMREILFYKGRK